MYGFLKLNFDYLKGFKADHIASNLTKCNPIWRDFILRFDDIQFVKIKICLFKRL